MVRKATLTESKRGKVAMSLFGELCALATEWEVNQNKYWFEVYRVAENLARGFGGYIEAPGAFEDPKTNIATPYVKVMRHNFESGENTPQDTDSLTDAFYMDDDGYMRFSIATAFERSPEVFPKLRVGVFLRLKVSGDIVDAQLLNRTYIRYDFDATKPESRVKLFQAMVDLIKSGLEGRPWDGTTKQSIGFETTRNGRSQTLGASV
jgi:hypothetical protein